MSPIDNKEQNNHFESKDMDNFIEGYLSKSLPAIASNLTKNNGENGKIADETSNYIIIIKAQSDKNLGKL